MKDERKIHALCSLPSNDGNFHSTLKSACDEDLTEALALMEASPEGNLTRILGVKYEIKARTKAKNEAEAEMNSPQLDISTFLESEDRTDNIISFPTATENTDDKVEAVVTESPDVDTTTTVGNCVENIAEKVKVPTPTDTTKNPAEVMDSVSNVDTPKPIEENDSDDKVEDKKESTKVVEPELTPFEAAIQDYCSNMDITPCNKIYTATDVFEKLSKEKVSFPDRDSAYVINKLIDKSGKDQALCNAIMQEHKSYKKAFQYFAQKARSKEAGIEMEGGMYLDRDIAYDLAVDYFFLDEAKAEAERKAKEEEKKKKAEEEKKRKAEEKKAAKKSTTRKPRKKKGENEEVATTPADTPSTTDTLSTETTEVKSEGNEGVVDTISTDIPTDTITESTPEVPTVVENDVTESDTAGVTEDNNGSTTEGSTEATTEVEPVKDGSFEVKDSVIMDSPRLIEEPVEEAVEEPYGQLSFTFI